MESLTQKLARVVWGFRLIELNCSGRAFWTIGGSTSSTDRSRHASIRDLTIACFGAGVAMSSDSSKMLHISSPMTAELRDEEDMLKDPQKASTGRRGVCLCVL